jgi:PAS domain S-box-containing protein
MKHSLKTIQINRKIPSFAKVLESTPASLSIKNIRLEYVYYNNKFSELFGLTEEVKNDFDLFIPEVAFELNQEDSNALTSELEAEIETAVITKQGLQKVITISRSIYEDKGEKYIISLIRDITDTLQDKHFEAYKQVLSEADIYEKLLNRFSNFIFSTNDKREIMEGVGKLCLDLLNLDDLSIFIYNEERKLLEQRVFILGDKIIRYDETGTKFKNIPLNSGLTGRAARLQETVIVNDVSQDPDFISDNIDCVSEIAVPIIYKNKLIGVIDSESTKANYYKGRIKNTFEGITSLLAIKLNELDNLRKLSSKNYELESLILHHPLPVVMLDQEFNYLEASQVWIDQYVKDKTTSIIGQNHFTLNPNIPLRWKRVIKKALKGETQVLKKEYYRRKNGQNDWFSAKVSPWYTPNDEVGGVIIVAEIISEQVENEIKLLKSNEELIDARKIGKLYTWSCDPETGEFQWDSGVFEASGLEQNKKYSFDALFELIDEEYHEDFNRNLSQAIDNKTGFEFVHPLNMKGKKHWIHNRVKVECENNRITRIVGTGQDITDQMDAKSAYIAKNEELTKINEELDQFVYKTAHDLRAPLANLIGLIGVMRNESDMNLLNSYFDLQEQSINKLDDFIQKITTYTKNARLPIIEEKINFNVLIDDILSSYMYYDKSMSVSKVVNIEPGLEFYSDVERVGTIMRNLISNAIKFSNPDQEDSKLRIDIKKQGSSLSIVIKDNGLGISEKIQKRVFDMFYRGHKSADGAGIGLYIVNETIHKLNGKLKLSSEEGVFTEFKLLLPNLDPNQLI